MVGAGGGEGLKVRFRKEREALVFESPGKRRSSVRKELGTGYREEKEMQTWV
jgi:hypothetical protein